MNKILKPMKAEAVKDTASLVYPLYASPKYDGIRCVVHDGVALSNTLKPIRNETVQAWARTNSALLDGSDGELISGKHDELVFPRTSSVIMSADGGDEWRFHAFDNFLVKGGFERRLQYLRRWDHLPPKVARVPQIMVHDEKSLIECFETWTAEGYEGAMLRAINSPYKHGRSTLKEGYLLKLKPFEDNEARIVGSYEMMHNDNEAKTNELGRTKRSQHAAGLRPANTLGGVHVVGINGRWKDVEFDLAAWGDHVLRAALWASRASLVGRIVTYKHLLIGAKDKPRIPIAKWFRDPEDMS